MLWVFNHQFADWEARLHKDTRHQLLQDRHGQGIHHKGVMKREVLEGELKDYGGVSGCGSLGIPGGCLLLARIFALAMCGVQA